jgi:hypothetical protein
MDPIYQMPGLNSCEPKLHNETHEQCRRAAMKRVFGSTYLQLGILFHGIDSETCETLDQRAKEADSFVNEKLRRECRSHAIRNERLFPARQHE